MMVMKNFKNKGAAVEVTRKQLMLPQEIVLEILARLPAKTLIRFKCVRKEWCSLVSDPFFMELHREHAKAKPGVISALLFTLVKNNQSEQSYFTSDFNREPARNIFSHKMDMDTPPFMEFEAINGLICLKSKYDLVHICNPTTREIALILPTRLRVSLKYWLTLSSYSFGFDPCTKQYKVLHVRQKLLSCAQVYKANCEIFTLGTHRWRKLKDVHPPLPWQDIKSCCVNGVMYWRVMPGYYLEPTHDHKDDAVVAFSLKDENFKTIPNSDGASFMDMMFECGGCLAIYSNFRFDLTTNYVFEYYILEDSDKLDCWKKEKLILHFELVQQYPLCFRVAIRSGEFLFLKKNTSGSFWAYYYDLRTSCWVESYPCYGP